MMDRRTLISAIALATVCARSGAFAQQQRSWRVGFVALPERPEPLEGSRFGAFALGMRELGYIERRNLTIEWRFAGGEVGRLAELAAEVVQRKVDVIVAGETPVISAAQKATATIPIVMAGVSILSTDLSGKLVEMLQNVAIDIGGRTPVAVGEVLAVDDQSSGLYVLPEREDRRQPVLERELRDSLALLDEK